MVSVARFYDLRRNPIICPSCDAEFDPELVQKSRRNKTASSEIVAKPDTAKKAVGGATAIEDSGELKDPDVEETDNSDEDEVIEDVSGLGEDASEVETIIHKPDDDN